MGKKLAIEEQRKYEEIRTSIARGRSPYKAGFWCSGSDGTENTDPKGSEPGWLLPPIVPVSIHFRGESEKKASFSQSVQPSTLFGKDVNVGICD
jgi:hypothetical protein